MNSNPSGSAREPLHITLKWPARPELALPEVMVNAYGPDAAAVEVLLAEAAAAVAPFVAAMLRADTAVTPPSPAPAPRREPARPPVVSRIPAAELAQGDRRGDCPSPTCSLEGVPMMTSQYGGLFCPGADDTEADGRCRWVFDDKGLRRKPTRAEVDAARAAGRGRR